MKERYLKLSINSQMERGREAVEKIQNFIHNYYHFIDDNDVTDLKLIFSELVYNAILHGNKQDDNKAICVEIELSEDGHITSVIKDQGDGYNYAQLLESISVYDDGNYYSQASGGRGVLLVKALSDSLSFNNKGNEITFSKKVAFNNAQYNNS